jgi:hypothetical protein
MIEAHIPIDGGGLPILKPESIIPMFRLMEFGGLALFPANLGGDWDLPEKLSFVFDVGQKGLVIVVHGICTQQQPKD